jgi:uncharacterized protein YbjT (DUF2867 family)
MNVLIFGATGMVGQGVLRESLLDPGVESVLTIGRTLTGVQNPKLKEIAHTDMWEYASLEDRLAGFDACFFCLGASSAGMKPEDYERLTYGITMAAAETLARLNPRMTFIYVSGAGTDSSERGRTMWARVKGKTENDLLRLPFHAAYMFRPGFIEPRNGATSKTKAYRLTYSLVKPLMPVIRSLFRSSILTTEEVGLAMIKAVRRGAPKQILEIKDIQSLLKN